MGHGQPRILRDRRTGLPVDLLLEKGHGRDTGDFRHCRSGLAARERDNTVKNEFGFSFKTEGQ